MSLCTSCKSSCVTAQALGSQTGERALEHARKFHPELLESPAAECIVNIGALVVCGLPHGFLLAATP